VNVDNPQQPPAVLSLCAGYSGIELALDGVFGGVAPLAYVEIEAYAVANLVAKMESGQMVPAPVWTDLKTLNAGIFRDRVDILTGGYPCQPFSAAGKRLGADDPRHLWPHIERIIDECEPRMCFFENVEGHISLGLREVLYSLESRGYKTAWGIFSASEVGAPHQRKRVFILAHAESLRTDGKAGGCCGEAWGPWGALSREPVRTGCGPALADRHSLNRSAPAEGWQYDAEAGRAGEALADRISAGPQGHPRNGDGRDEPGRVAPGPHGPVSQSGVCQRWPARPGEDQYEWEEPRVVKSRLGGTTHGASSRVDRLRLLGNGVVPQTAEKAFRTLYREIMENKMEKKPIQASLFGRAA